MAEHRRQAAEARGRKGERLAALALQLKGYRILGRRVKTPVGEIDLVAKRGSVIVFVEVKARTTKALALDAVPQSSWNRISRAAEACMARRPAYASLGWRFDLVAIVPGRWPHHMPDAWRP